MSSTPTMFKFLNPIMKTILRSPLHKMISGQILIISFKGRKSGKEYNTPVSYFRETDKVYVFTHANWWKNLVGGVQVQVRIQGQDFLGQAEPIADDVDQIAEMLAQMLVAVPSDARFYNVTLDSDGQPNPEEVRKAAAEAVMIQIKLEA